ncbi:uncharacterized protein LOC111206833 isoform X2 [Brassica napus]|uniref:uncharacterized protein LOC111206833 isoform X2 n=1 Tax=Brassica napus TaxID=3708 RepID=UPI002078E834|nr:uncharacterized protein LOC111206833 isoform X2 [Brassica napus]
MAALSYYFCDIVEECIENNLSKDETMRHLWDKYLIPHEYTNRVWNHLERTNPDLFIAYNARIRERKAQPVYPSSQAGPSTAANEDFCQQVLNALGHIIKLLSDGHGVAPHPSATGSLKRKRVDENEERGENEGEKLQENERGVNEEAEKQITEKDEGNDEELQKKEEGDNEELQKNER